MLKHSFKILVLLISTFVVIANIGCSVVALDAKQSVEISNPCCSDQTMTNSCCELKTDSCETKDVNSCCCSQSHQVVQFFFNAPINEEVNEVIFHPLVAFLSFIQNVYFEPTVFAVDSFVFPPPKIGLRLSLLQTYRI